MSIARCPECGKVISLRFPLHDCTQKPASTPAPTRAIQFNRFGLAEDPVGLHVVMPNGALREVYGTYIREETSAVVVLKVRSFNREILEEITAGSARVLDREAK